jgi:hypothetical protein
VLAIVVPTLGASVASSFLVGSVVRAERLAAPGRRVACVLNGDWHWLDADAEAFAAVQCLAAPFVLLGVPLLARQMLERRKA